MCAYVMISPNYAIAFMRLKVMKVVVKSFKDVAERQIEVKAKHYNSCI